MGKFRKKLKSALLIFAIGLTFSIYALPASCSHKGIELEIDSLIKKSLPNASLGILLLDSEQGTVLYERNATELFPPASTTKLFTAAAALLSLGPSFQFETALLAEKTQIDKKSGKILGDLYFRFEGDPSLTLLDLKKCIADLKAQNIHEILGNIVIDDSCFQAPDYGMGWSWDKLSWYYAAPITSIIIEQNQVPITFNSNDVISKKVAVALADKEGIQLGIKSDISIVSPEEAKVRCQLLVNMDPKNHLTLEGCWPEQAEAVTLKFAIKDPYYLLQELLKESFGAQAIHFSAKIIRGSIPDTAKLQSLVSHYSKPLSQLLIPVLHDSNNMYSESLLKTLGYKHFSKGSFQLGAAAVTEVLSQSSDFDFSSLLLVDGSGLSAYNWVSPEQLAKLLLRMHPTHKGTTHFKDALAISGESEGTLKQRLDVPELKGRIRAKTGSLNGISTLAGYLSNNQSKELIFVIMIDHVIDQEKMKNFQNELCKIFIKAEVKANRDQNI